MVMTHREQLRYINSLPRTQEWSKKISISKTKPKVELVCVGCGKVFYVTESKKNTKYCSKDCIHTSKTELVKCLICGKQFEKYKKRNNTKYCSRECLNISKKGVATWNKGTIGLVGSWNKGRHLSEETKKKLSESHKGKPGYFKGKKRPTGENSCRWIKDRSLLKKSEKKHLDTAYRNWMFAVKNRDNWKCKINNCQCSGRLEAHHILNWIDFPEERYNINNGITLCQAHHPRKRIDEKRLIPIFKELIGSYEQ